MADKKELRYPDEPKSIQEITKQYIKDYYLYESKAGKLSNEDIKAFANVVEQAEKDAADVSKPDVKSAFKVYRDKFVELHFKHLATENKEKASDFFKALIKE